MTVTSDPTYGLLTWMRGACVGALLSMRVATTPSPASRPRVSKFGTYYAKAYALFLADCQRQFAEQKPPGEPMNGPLVSISEIVVAKPKTTKRLWPRGDSDNFGKAPLDGATKAGVWVDDDNVIIPIPIKRYAEPGEEPGIIFHAGELRA